MSFSLGHILIARVGSSVASVLLLGGKPPKPNVPTEKKNHVHVYLTYMRERAPQKYMYVFRSQNTSCIHAYNQCSGMAL